MSSKECPTCLDEYDLEDRRVRMLNCGHTQCTACIKAQFSNGRITCCICRVSHNYPNVQSIPINYTAETLLKDQSAPFVPKLHKGLCEDHGQHKLFKCSTHDKWICTTCSLLEHPRGECEIISIKKQLESEKQIAKSNMSDEIKILEKTDNDINDFWKQLDDTINDDQEIIEKMTTEMERIKKKIAMKEESIAISNAKKLEMKQLKEDIKKNKSEMEVLMADLMVVDTFKDLGTKKLQCAKSAKQYDTWKDKMDQENKSILFDVAILPMLQKHLCFLTLTYKETNLGTITIQLTPEYPRYSQHFHTLASGGGSGGATWRGASFNHGVLSHNSPGEHLACLQYVSASGDLTQNPLFALESAAASRSRCEGDVQGYGSGGAGFMITTRSGGYTGPWPLIGRVTSGLPLLKTIAAKGHDYAKQVKFADCGVTL